MARSLDIRWVSSQSRQEACQILSIHHGSGVLSEQEVEHALNLLVPPRKRSLVLVVVDQHQPITIVPGPM